ncbi:hypothetical protein MRX96_030149 [Rhipicephalus microplus]
MLAEKTKPLRELLLNKAVEVWYQTELEDFDWVKDDMTRAPVLSYYEPQRLPTTSADGSCYRLGAVLLPTKWRRPAAASCICFQVNNTDIAKVRSGGEEGTCHNMGM